MIDKLLIMFYETSHRSYHLFVVLCCDILHFSLVVLCPSLYDLCVCFLDFFSDV